MNESRIADLLDTLTPSYDDRAGDWERVAADANANARERRGRAPWWAARAVTVAVAAATVAALVLAWPFQADQPGLLERARAAIGDGPVLHVVLRGDWGGTLVDLESGKRSPVHGERGLVRQRPWSRPHGVAAWRRRPA